MFILKLTSKFNVFHTRGVSQGRLFILISNFKFYIRSIRKKNFKRNLLSCMGVYKTLACIFSTFFQVTGTWVNYSHSFFPAEHNYQSLFFITSSFPEILCQTSKKVHKDRYISIAISLCFMKFFNIFFGSQGGSDDIVWHQMKFISFYDVLFKEIAWNFLMLYF